MAMVHTGNSGPLEVSDPALKACLDWIYLGACNASGDDELHDVLAAAHYLRIAPLVEAAAREMLCRLGPTTAIATWTVAQKYALGDVTAAALTTACEHFSVLTATEE